MKVAWKLAALAIVLAFAGCASQEPAETEETTSAPQQETEIAAQPAEVADQTPQRNPQLDAPGVAVFEIGDGTTLDDGASITLATGGPVNGRLLPASSDTSVTLYMTRDGSVPSAENNWGGAIDPSSPPPVTRRLEGSGTYRLVAELDGEYSDVTTVYVKWQHEEDPQLDAPAFTLAGEVVSGSVEIRTSDGTIADRRLYIQSNYADAQLFITRDGSDPGPDSYWKAQRADGTYLFSPEPTAAAYRVVAVWQDATSPVASLDVTWVE